MEDSENITTPRKQIPIPPVVGMEFDSYEDAYEFYNTYARIFGFGIRVKNSYKGRSSTQKLGAVLCCCRAGFKSNINSTKERPRKRIGCLAMMRLKLGELKWKVTEVKLDHNHETTPSSVRFYRSHKNISAGVRKKLELHCDAGIRTNKTYHSLVVEAGGHEHLTFDEKDVRNYVTKYKQLKLKEGDAQALHDHFSDMQTKNPNFFYLIDFDKDARLRNVFWADARSRSAYKFFGDVVTFDTTYLTNRYDMPFAPFVGVNHHGQSVLLGCGLLANETTESFVWLFRTWLTCMSGRSPHAIITDQSKAIQRAVSDVFPEARHRLCLWHIMQKVPQKLRGSQHYAEIKLTMESVVYDSLIESDFEASWQNMIQVYELSDNEWLQTLYEERGKWVPAFLKGTFFAGMSTTQRSESINAFFDGYVHSRTSLSDFASKYKLALEDKHQKEARADFDSRHTDPVLKTKCVYEKQLSKIYTSCIFKKFQHEVEEMLSCFTSQVNITGAIITYIVKERVTCDENVTRTLEYEVLYHMKEQLEVECICNMFNFKGYLCRHALTVLHYNGIDEIPSKYILSRWRKDFKRQYVASNTTNDIDYIDPGKWYDQLFACAIQVVEEGMVSQNHFEAALHALEESVRKVQLVDNVAKKSTCKESSMPDETKMQDPVLAKRPGRPKQNRLKIPMPKIRKNNQKKKLNVQGHQKIEPTTFGHSNKTSNSTILMRSHTNSKQVDSSEHANQQDDVSHWLSGFDTKILSFVARVGDVPSDGHCGYHCVAQIMGMDPTNGWLQVRQDMLKEVRSHANLYNRLCYDVEGYQEIQRRLSHFGPCCGEDGYMMLPQMGHIVASTYDVIFVALHPKQCLTFLPLRNPPNSEKEVKIISVALVGKHFVKLSFYDNAPLPPVAGWWQKNSYPWAQSWLNKVSDRCNAWKTVVLNPSIATTDILDD